MKPSVLIEEAQICYVDCTATGVEAADSCSPIAVGHFNESEKKIIACVVVGAW